MNDSELQTRLRRLLQQHEVELDADEDGWLLTDGDYPAIRATWHDGNTVAPGRLDIDLVLADERELEESFAGADLDEALQAFIQTALPALLAACWYVTDDRALGVAGWTLGLRDWDVFIGRPTVRGDVVALPPALNDAVADALRQAPLAPQLHWLRWFVRRAAASEIELEVLLDNAPWPAGQTVLGELDWPATGSNYSAHGLILLDVRDY